MGRKRKPRKPHRSAPNHRLTMKEQAFCREWPKDENGRQAAIRAGYAPSTADNRAWYLLGKKEIRDAIDEIRKEAAMRLDISDIRVLREYAKLGFANMDDYSVLLPTGERVPDLSRCTRDQMAAVAELTVDEYVEGRGEDKRTVKRIKFKLHSKVQALDALAKHLGLFQKDNEQSRADMDPLAALIKAVQEGDGKGRIMPKTEEPAGGNIACQK